MICTFYSFKGGVGRSMALANVSQRFARRGLRTLMIDFDLEAPGLERFFPIDPATVVENPGVIDLLVDYKRSMAQPVGRTARGFQELHRFIVPIYRELPGGGHLHLLPAGRRGDEEQLSAYAQALRTFDWQEFYFEWGGALFFQWLAKELASRYDVTLVDSRTGVTEMGGVCAYQLADTLVMFCAPNVQNVQGTRDVLRNFASDRVSELRMGRALNALVVPSRVEAGSPQLGAFQKEFADFEPLAPAALTSRGLTLWNLLLPYDPAYAFVERLALDGDTAEGAIGRAYDRLAAAVALVAPAGTKLAEVGEQLARAVLGVTAVTGEAAVASMVPEYDPTASFAGYDVFLSFAARDGEFADQIRTHLKDAGCNVFNPPEMAAGAHWRSEIERALSISAAIFVLVGGEMAQHQLHEVHTALNLQAGGGSRRIVPILLPGTSPEMVAGFLQPFQSIDLRSGLNDETRAALVAAAAGSSRRGQVSYAEENPYPGLRPFDESDARFMFGREREQAEAMERVPHGFLAVIGASGSGKTTLLRAGILPRLRTMGPAADRIVLVRPGTDPIGQLASEIARVVGVQPQALLDPNVHPGVMLDALAQAGGRGAVLVDQLEELWRIQDRDVRFRYLDLLASAGRANPNRLAVVVTLRSDFYGETAEHREFAELVSKHQLLLGPMSAIALRDAIEKPAQMTGVRFEPGLIERMIQDTEGSDRALPLLQLALHRLWDDRRQGFLTHESYDRLGGKHVVARIAEEAYEALPAKTRDAARGVFLRLLSPDGMRLSVPRQEFSPVERTAVEAFVQARLLVIGYGSATADFVELSNVGLVRDWPRLGQWFDEARGSLFFRTRLQAAVDQWRANGSSRDYLYRGRALTEAAGWLRANPELASADTREFVRASARARRNRTLTIAATGFAAVALLAVVLASRMVAQPLQDLQDPTNRPTYATRAYNALGWAFWIDRDSLFAEYWRRRAAARETPRDDAIAGLLKSLTLADTAEARAALKTLIGDDYRALVRTFRVAQAWGAMYSPDGSTVLTVRNIFTSNSGRGGGEIQEWDARSGEPRGDRMRFGDAISAVHYSSDGSFIGVGGVPVANQMPECRLWYRVGGRQVSLRTHGECRELAIGPASDVVATGDDDGVILWDIDGRQLRSFKLGSFVADIEFSPDGSLVMALSENGVRVWRVRSGEPSLALAAGSTVRDAAFDPRGRWIVTASTDGVEFWNIADGRRIGPRLVSDVGAAGVTVSPDGRFVATSNGDRIARLWVADSGEPRCVIALDGDPGTLSFTADSTRLIVADGSGKVAFWSLDSCRQLGVAFTDTGRMEATVNPSTRTELLTNAADGVVRQWTLDTNGLPPLDLTTAPAQLMNTWLRKLALHFNEDGDIVAGVPR